jgi:putative oxidoreductase
MDAYDIGMLILRLGLGLTLAAHGFQKFLGPDGLDGAAGMFESIGFRPGILNAWLAAIAEITAGLGLAAGFLTPLSAAGFVALMVVAAWTVHRSGGFFATGGGWEYNLVLALSAVGVATVGPGRISLDWAFFRDASFSYLLHGWAGLVLSVGIGLIAAMLQMAIFYRPHAEVPA